MTIECIRSLCFHSVNCFFQIYFQVNRDDDSTKVCQQCFEMVNEYLPFRRKCSTRNMSYLLQKIVTMQEKLTDVDSVPVAAGVIDKSNSAHDTEHSTSNIDLGRRNSPTNDSSSVICILDDSDEENAAVAYNSGSGNGNSSSKYKRLVNFPVKCARKHCPYFFESTNAMTYHVDNYHRKGITKTFECTLCKNTLNLKRSLPARVHARHKCAVSMCSQSFNSKADLDSHVNFVLCEKSGQFLNGQVLKQQNNGNFPIECTRGYSKNYFTSVKEMMYHVEMYHAKGIKKAYECYVCRKKIGSMQTLQQHMDTRH